MAAKPCGKCKWIWVTSQNDWVQIEDHCKGDCQCIKPAKSTTPPKDGTIIVRVCQPKP
jgi:hypothetical protein